MVTRNSMRIICKETMQILIKSFFIFVFCLSCKNVTGKSLETEIYEIIEKYHVIGVSTVVVKDNEIIFNRAFGYNPDYNDSMRRDTIPYNGIYVIASISKSFIATAIMQLEERHMLNLDDNVNKYLDFRISNPQYPNIPITVRMLLDQRSSINDKQYGSVNNINPEKGKKWKECYNDYRPGTRFNYCNFNYTILGVIIEKVTGKRFFDYIDDNIVTPLELNASYNLTKMDSSLLVRSYQYDNKAKKFKKEDTIYDPHYYRDKLKNYKLGSTTAFFSPSGGVKISALDLAKYMMMYMNYGRYNGVRILSKESVIEMWRPQGADEPTNSYFSQYGLSFSRWSKIVDGESFVGITGGAHGVHSAMYFNPEKKYGFVVICNGCTSDIIMKDSIVKILYKYLIKE